MTSKDLDMYKRNTLAQSKTLPTFNTSLSNESHSEVEGDDYEPS